MQRLNDLLDQRADGRMLGIGRIILGIAALAKGVLMAISVQGFQSGDHLRLPYGPWEISTPEGLLATIASISWIIFAIFFAVGFGTRLSGALLAAMIAFVIGLDQQFYSNHLYLLLTVVVLMTVADPGARYSIDARRLKGSGDVPRWALILIMLQLTSVYFFAAITKLNDGFLSGRVMERAFEPAMLDRVEQVTSLELLAPLAIGTELFLAFAFWSSRLRKVALPLGIGFHVANVAIMDRSGTLNLSVFALIMISMMVVYFTRDRVFKSQAKAFSCCCQHSR